jgi:hypothetical protein
MPNRFACIQRLQQSGLDPEADHNINACASSSDQQVWTFNTKTDRPAVCVPECVVHFSSSKYLPKTVTRHRIQALPNWHVKIIVQNCYTKFVGLGIVHDKSARHRNVKQWHGVHNDFHENRPIHTKVEEKYCRHALPYQASFFDNQSESLSHNYTLLLGYFLH